MHAMQRALPTTTPPAPCSCTMTASGWAARWWCCTRRPPATPPAYCCSCPARAMSRRRARSPSRHAPFYLYRAAACGSSWPCDIAPGRKQTARMGAGAASRRLQMPTTFTDPLGGLPGRRASCRWTTARRCPSAAASRRAWPRTPRRARTRARSRRRRPAACCSRTRSCSLTRTRRRWAPRHR